MDFIAPVIRKVAVLLVGIPLLIVGLILIPLPGPGLLVCFGALFILSLEFDWARGHVRRLKGHFKNIWEKSLEASKQARDKHEK